MSDRGPGGTSDPANTPTYDRLYRAYRDLYEATAPIVHRLSGEH
ncbi:hypothetical protein GCM10023322_75970 [Rugosimonospora acidiphila]|uniref:SAM-dependent methyltransferase n=1 Tax=Rugosimonospora acidiphila TaxID=556531 RepID=A0ABP9SNI4_9ACTN